MRITVVRPEELGSGEMKRWREIQRATPALVHPFLGPEFAAAVGRHRAQARVAVLEEGARIVGFFPFEERSLGLGVPIAAGLTTCQGMVHEPDLDWDPQQLLRACGLAAWEFDFLVSGQAPFESSVVHRSPSPVMDLRAGFEQYVASLKAASPGLAKDVRRKQRKLERDVGEVGFVFDSGDHGALRTLMSWKSAQYQRTGRVDRFARPWISALLDDLLDIRTDSFSSVLCLLSAGGELVAGHLLLRMDDVLAGWFPSYDTRFSRYSPGTVTRMRMARAAADRGAALVHMGASVKNEYKQVFKSHDVFVGEGRVLRASPAAAVHWLRRAPVRRVRLAVAERPALVRMADRALHRYGQLRTALTAPNRVEQPVSGGMS